VAPGKVGLIPKNVSFEEAAALVLVGVSAWQALVPTLKLAAGEKIFINGGAGGIGGTAVQIAKHLGAHVTASARGADAEFVRELGADEVIDYQKEDFKKELSGFDALFDTVRGDDFNAALGILKRGGRAVSMTGGADAARAEELGVTATGQGTQVTTEATGRTARAGGGRRSEAAGEQDV